MTAQGPAHIIAAMSRIDRVAGRGIRERDRRLRTPGRPRPSRREIELHEAMIARLTRVHQVTFRPIDWARIEADGPVAPMISRDAVSSVARQNLANYRPSLVDNLLGLEREKRRELTHRVVEAAKADAELYAQAKAQAAAHNRVLALAPEVRAMNAEAIAGVLKANGADLALKDVVEGFRIVADGKSRLIGQLDLWEYDALPDEACASSGYVPVSETDRGQLQLANACAVALRAAIEILQIAPVATVDVVARVCRPGGLAEADLEPVLHVQVPAEAVAKPHFHKLDATEAAAALGARIDWSPARGLGPIRIDDPFLARLTAPREAA